MKNRLHGATVTAGRPIKRLVFATIKIKHDGDLDQKARGGGVRSDHILDINAV